MVADDSSERSGGWTPRPDPTVLTTEALGREIAHLREYLESMVEAHGRLDGQKFESIDQRFQDRDLLVQQAFENVSAATAAALASSKEAVAKSEVDVAKQLDGLRTLIDSRAKAVDGQIGDVKERLDKSEGRGSATTYLIGVGLSVVAVITAITSVALTVLAR